MRAVEARRAVAAATSTASALGLAVEDAVVLSDSNRLVVRLRPCDVVARATPVENRAGARREVELAGRLGETTGAIAVLDPRVEPRLFVRDRFAISLWAYFEPVVPPREVPAADYTDALQRLHAVMEHLDLPMPHFTDRVADTRRWVEDPALTPDLTDADREVLAETLRSLGQAIVDRGATEQLLHGEPHPGNVLSAENGPLFIDFENSVCGPVEYDLGWVPGAVAERHPGADHVLLDECRGLVLALIAAHRWHRDDQHPSGRRSGEEILGHLRAGPPWPALDAL